MADLTGYITSVYIEPGAVVTLKDQYPSANNYTMEVTQSGTTQSLTWHDGKDAIDDTVIALDSTWSSNKINTEIGKKMTTPTDRGSAGYVLSTDGNNNFYWRVNVGTVKSVNGLTGDVILNSQNVKMADDTTIEATVNGKITNPTIGTSGQYLKKTDTGVEWSTVDAGVKTVNSKAGDVVLTGEDICINTEREIKLSTAVLGVQVNGDNLTPTNNIINIPLAGSTVVNEKNEDIVVAGIVNVKPANGIEIDTTGYLKFNDVSLNVLNGSHKSVCAKEYDKTNIYNIGDYVNYNGYLYVCKHNETTGDFNLEYWCLTNSTDELNNLLAQLIAAVGLKENTRTWDETNDKVIYNFEMKV